VTQQTLRHLHITGEFKLIASVVLQSVWKLSGHTADISIISTRNLINTSKNCSEGLKSTIHIHHPTNPSNYICQILSQNPTKGGIHKLLITIIIHDVSTRVSYLMMNFFHFSVSTYKYTTVTEIISLSTLFFIFSFIQSLSLRIILLQRP